VDRHNLKGRYLGVVVLAAWLLGVPLALESVWTILRCSAATVATDAFQKKLNYDAKEIG
jgi:hypothetical protein